MPRHEDDPKPARHKALGRRARVARSLRDITDTLEVSGLCPAATDVLATNRRLGKEAPRIAERAANTVDLCPKPFAHIKPTAQQVRDDIERLKELEECLTCIDSTQQSVRNEMNLIRVRLDGFVGQVYTAAQGALTLSFWDEAEQADLRAAAQPFFGALDERAESIRTAMSDTRAKNSETATRVAETEAKSSRLEIENRYLSGQDLRPSDFIAAPRAEDARPAPRAARRGRGRRSPTR